MGAFRRYLEAEVGKNHLTNQHASNAAEILQHGVRSMIAEGQDPHDVYRRAIPIFGEEFLIEAGIVELVAEQENA